MVIFIAILMAAIAVVIVAWPIVRGRSAPSPSGEENDPVLGELMVRREAVLTAIKDLEFDYAVGKIEEGDFQALNAQLRAEAIEVLKELDRCQSLSGSTGQEREADIEARLEREIAQRRRKRAPASPALDAQIEAEIAALRHGATFASPSPNGRACPRCGTPLDEEDRFCRRCGASVHARKGG